jgi:hypothetical protein
LNLILKPLNIFNQFGVTMSAKNPTTLAFLPVITALMLLASGALAQESGKKRGHRGPPPEAIEACTGAEVGQVCEFTGGRGEAVSGSCIVPRRGESQTLACKPSGARPEGKSERSEEDNN